MSIDQEQRLYPENIMEQDLPCWYELSWQDQPATIILKIHKDFIQNERLISSDHPTIQNLMETFKFSNYNNDFSKDVGFGGVFKNNGIDDNNFVVFKAEIPEIENKHKSDRQPAILLSASLTALTFQVGHLDKKTPSQLSQLFVLRMITKENRFPLWVIVSLNLHNWLKDQMKNSKADKKIIAAMEGAYQKMFSEGINYMKSNLDVRQWENGSIIAGGFRQRWGLNPDYNSTFDIKNGRGYTLESGNIDTPMQQIILIAGLAALHDAARREMVK